MGLVGMLMGEKNRVDMIDTGIDQLLAQIRRGVDDDPGRPGFAGSLHQKRAAASSAFWIVRIAGAPAECRSRAAGRRSAAENGERQRHTWRPDSDSRIMLRRAPLRTSEPKGHQ